jgi:hypothetical protein
MFIFLYQLRFDPVQFIKKCRTVSVSPHINSAQATSCYKIISFAAAIGKRLIRLGRAQPHVSSQVGGTTLTYSDFTEKFWGSVHRWSHGSKIGGTCPPVPM